MAISCFGTFVNDRTCELCEIVDRNAYVQCKQKKINDKEKLKRFEEQEMEEQKKLWAIQKKCPYYEKHYSYDDGDIEEYWVCSKNSDKSCECTYKKGKCVAPGIELTTYKKA